MLHWCQDFKRVSSTPSIDGLTQDDYLATLTVFSERAEARKVLIDQSNTKSKEASPGPLVSENKWTDWKPRFVNYVSTSIGINWVPLSYVVRPNEIPDRTGPFVIFTEECSSCTPLSGVGYEAES